MQKCRFLITFFTLIFFLASANLYSVDKIDDLSFTNTEVTQVLKIISEIFAITIVPDKDINGTVTRYFKDTTLEQTLTLLLEPLDFSYEIIEGIYFVRRKPLYDISYDENRKVYQIDSSMGRLQAILEKMSALSRKTIIFNGSSEDRVSIKIFDKPFDVAVKTLADSLSYEIKKEGDLIYVTKKEEELYDMQSGPNIPGIMIRGPEDKIDIMFSNKSSKDVILALFSKYKKEVSIFSRSASMIPFINLKEMPFDEILEIMVNFSGQAFTKVDGKYYIYDTNGVKEINKYRVTNTYKFKNMDYKSFISMVPTQVIPGSIYKIDSTNNTITFFGSPDQVNYYYNMVETIDNNMSNFKNRVFKLKFLQANKIKSYLPPQFQTLRFSIVDESNMVYTYLDDVEYDKLKDILEQIDVAPEGFKYKFKYLDPEEVMKSLLPAYIIKNKVKFSKNDSSLYFDISKEAKAQLFKYLETIDVAAPVIRYQLLIVEYTNKKNLDFKWGLGFKQDNSVTSFRLGDNGVTIGDVGESSGINANFDIPTAFGYYFSANLSAQLREDKAKIQLSSEVYGLSGEKVTLKNTDELHFKSSKLDKDGNQVSSYDSIMTGLNLEITGRSTAHNEIYIEVSANISDSKKGSSDAPDKTEKAVKSAVRTKTGKPIILGGLTSKKEQHGGNVIPGLGQIPIIGNAFRSHEKLNSESEFIIYIIPFIQKSEDDIKKERRELIKDIYEHFIKKKG